MVLIRYPIFIGTRTTGYLHDPILIIKSFFLKKKEKKKKVQLKWGSFLLGDIYVKFKEGV